MPHRRTVGEEARLAQPLCENRLQTAAATRIEFRTKLTSTVPKKSKNESKIVATPAADPLSSSASATAGATQKRSKASRTGSPKRATSKKPAGSAARKSTTTKAARPAASNRPSDEEVRVRAYLLAERRIRMALQGDPAADWLEAREQLIAEAQQKQA